MSKIQFRDTHGRRVDIQLSKDVQTSIDAHPGMARELGERLAEHIQKAILLDAAGTLFDRAYTSSTRLGSYRLTIYTRFIGNKTLGRVFFTERGKKR